MGLNLGGIVSAVFDPGKVVKDVVDAVLPEKFDVIADLAGAIVDFKTGRPLQGMGHLAQALKDLPQALADEKSVRGPNQDRPGGTPAFEPTPPPDRANPSEGLDWNKIADLFARLAKLFSPGQRGAPAPAEAPRPGAAASARDAGSIMAGVAEDWRGAPPEAGASATKKPSSSTKKASSTSSTSATTKKSSSANETTKKKETGDTKKATEKKATEKKAASGTAVAQLNKISDEELMKMVRNGSIPDEILNDQKAMLALQNRVQHITEMTKLMTQLLQTFHDIRMSVLHNVRA